MCVNICKQADKRESAQWWVNEMASESIHTHLSIRLKRVFIHVLGIDGKEKIDFMLEFSFDGSLCVFDPNIKL